MEREFARESRKSHIHHVTVPGNVKIVSLSLIFGARWFFLSHVFLPFPRTLIHTHTPFRPLFFPIFPFSSFLITRFLLKFHLVLPYTHTLTHTHALSDNVSPSLVLSLFPHLQLLEEVVEMLFRILLSFVPQ